MKVARLINDDWTLGNGLAGYISNEQAIYQNVKTRLRSFKHDWFLDTTLHIDWIALLGAYGKENDIKREIERVVLNTYGVTKITTLEVRVMDNRKLKIVLKFNTVFDNILELNEIIT